ncbi:MAG TPA: tRNA pseudouridine(55) synthase TruB [Bacilli bacterium]|nr:tRNA pseudouridine(55) synthase TruB [Bacilli bacterium]
MAEQVTNGIFLINKHAGVTSRRIDNLVMKKFNLKKVGHLGTLDPLATGLLIVAVNEATKTLPFYEDAPKTYEATFKFGLLTSTLDLEGEVLEEEEVTEIPLGALESAIAKFRGVIKQTPPIASALKVDGKRLYEYAREGQTVKIKAREVEVYELELLDYTFPTFKIRAKVSKGTYIRTLGQDIAQALGTNATTVTLERTHVGKYSVSDANSFENLTINDLKAVDLLLEAMPKISVSAAEVPLITNGRAYKHENKGNFVTIYYAERLLAIYEWKNAMYYAKRGFNL